MGSLKSEEIANSIEADKILFNGFDISNLKPNERRKLGISFIPEERIGHATVSSFNLSENFYLTDYIND